MLCLLRGRLASRRLRGGLVWRSRRRHRGVRMRVRVEEGERGLDGIEEVQVQIGLRVQGGNLITVQIG